MAPVECESCRIYLNGSMFASREARSNLIIPKPPLEASRTCSPSYSYRVNCPLLNATETSTSNPNSFPSSCTHTLERSSHPTSSLFPPSTYAGILADISNQSHLMLNESSPLLPSIPFTNPSPFQFQKVGCRVVLKLHRRLNTVLFYGTGMPGSESSPALLGASTVVVALHVAEMPKGGIPTRKNTLALSWLCGEPWLTEVEAMVKDLSARVLSRQLWIGGRVRDSGSAAVSGMRTRSVSSIFLFFFAQHEVKVILRTNGLAVRNI